MIIINVCKMIIIIAIVIVGLHFDSSRTQMPREMEMNNACVEVPSNAVDG